MQLDQAQNSRDTGLIQLDTNPTPYTNAVTELDLALACEVDSWKLLDENNKGVNIWMWIGAVIIFWPLCLICAILHFQKEYKVGVVFKCDSQPRVLTLELKEYQQFKIKNWNKEVA